MEQMQNNYDSQQQKTPLTRSSKILLPILFAFSLTLAFCFLFVDGFKNDISKVVLWVYFVVVILYALTAVLDIILRKEKKKAYIITVACLAVIADILYVVFYYI